MKHYRFLAAAALFAFAALVSISCAGSAPAAVQTAPADAVVDDSARSKTDTTKPAEPPSGAPKSATTDPTTGAPAPDGGAAVADTSGASTPAKKDAEKIAETERFAPAMELPPSPSPVRGEERPSGLGGAASGTGSAPSESGLKAGVSDDNEQYNYFASFIREHADEWPFRIIPVDNRLILRAVDASGRGIPNLALTIRDNAGKAIETLTTYADGAVLLTPPEDAKGRWTAEVGPQGTPLEFDPAGPRYLELKAAAARSVPAPVPLDIVFIMDTTGSMGEEIARLKATIEIIRENLDLANPRPLIRFGLVLYKDRRDTYVVQSYPLTADMTVFRANLAAASASGGGDEPEDLEAALEAAVAKEMGWNENGGRLIFVVTDAPAQNYQDAIGYDATTAIAREKAIKIHTIGTGGLPLAGEYQLRQMSQRTRGRYIFLTYGERGESAGGVAGAVSHHTGSNWTADKLETIIIRLAREELTDLGMEGVKVPADDWFEAKPTAERPRDEILDELFGETMKRLVDYSSAVIPQGAPAALLPVKPLQAVSNTDAGVTDAALKRNAEYFGMRLLQATAASKRFRLVERADLNQVLAEIELNLSAIGGEAIKLGTLLGAEYLIVPSLTRLPPAKDTVGGAAFEWEMSLRLVRVETAEILSVSRARIAGGLGLE